MGIFAPVPSRLEAAGESRRQRGNPSVPAAARAQSLTYQDKDGCPPRAASVSGAWASLRNLWGTRSGAEQAQPFARIFLRKILCQPHGLGNSRHSWCEMAGSVEGMSTCSDITNLSLMGRFSQHYVRMLTCATDLNLFDLIVLLIQPHSLNSLYIVTWSTADVSVLHIRSNAYIFTRRINI